MTGHLKWVLGLIAILVNQPAMSHHVELPEDMTQAQATWLWGHHSIPGDITLSGTPYWYVYPHTDVNQITNPIWSDVAATHIKPGAKAPAVLVLHGCSGMSYGSTEYRRYFINSGYAVFEPNSFARPGREACKRNALPARIEEIQAALFEIQQLAWVNQDQVYLMGISEGGVAVAGWGKPGFAAHIILATDCVDYSDRVPETPAGVPVLAVVGGNDQYSKGASCKVNTEVFGSRSIVIKDAGHGISDLLETGKAIDEFLRVVRAEG
jgi:dienelactone hydrolase